MTFSNISLGYSKEVSSIPRSPIAQEEMAYHTPTTIRFQRSMNNRQAAFVELSGTLDKDDPLEEFTAYMTDPVNWDPTQFIDRRFIYESNIGLEQKGNFGIGENTIRVGLETHAEEGLIHHVSPTSLRTPGVSSPLSLIDVRYAPYLTIQSTPSSWITWTGDVRFNFYSLMCRMSVARRVPYNPRVQRTV